MAVIRVLLNCAHAAGFRVIKHTLIRKHACGLCFQILPDGEPIAVLKHPHSGVILRLIPERAYTKTGSLHSIGFQQRPDIALEIVSPNAETRILIFDPKYKLPSEESGNLAENKDSTAKSGIPKKVDIEKCMPIETLFEGQAWNELSRIQQYCIQAPRFDMPMTLKPCVHIPVKMMDLTRE